MARLAADLKDFIDALQLEKPVVVGTSLGCAVIWAYVELYAAAHAAAHAATRATTHHAAAHAASTPAAASSPDLASEVRRRHIYMYAYVYIHAGTARPPWVSSSSSTRRGMPTLTLPAMALLTLTLPALALLTLTLPALALLTDLQLISTLVSMP